jgi:hypothetical protein
MQLYANPHQRKQMGINARQRIDKNFNKAQTIEQMLTIYHQLLK